MYIYIYIYISSSVYEVFHYLTGWQADCTATAAAAAAAEMSLQLWIAQEL